MNRYLPPLVHRSTDIKSPKSSGPKREARTKIKNSRISYMLHNFERNLPPRRHPLKKIDTKDSKRRLRHPWWCPRHQHVVPPPLPSTSQRVSSRGTLPWLDLRMGRPTQPTNMTRSKNPWPDQCNEHARSIVFDSQQSPGRIRAMFFDPKPKKLTQPE
jgi:hypothetical protein